MPLPPFEKTCFVLMPFGEKDTPERKKWQDIYDSIICRAIRESGLDLQPLRADQIARSGSIIDDIIRLCVKSHVVIADLTGRNPNVFYELGIRHSHANRTILMASRKDELPFDTMPLRTIIYSTVTENDRVLAVSDLKRFLCETCADPAEVDSPVLKLFSVGSQSYSLQIASRDENLPPTDTISYRASQALILMGYHYKQAVRKFYHKGQEIDRQNVDLNRCALYTDILGDSSVLLMLSEYAQPESPILYSNFQSALSSLSSSFDFEDIKDEPFTSSPVLSLIYVPVLWKGIETGDVERRLAKLLQRQVQMLQVLKLNSMAEWMRNARIELLDDDAIKELEEGAVATL